MSESEEPKSGAAEQVEVGKEAAGAPRKRRGLRVALSLMAILVVGGGVVALALLPVPEKETPPAKLLPVNVEVWPVVAVPELADSFEVTAVVEPEAVIDVAAEVSGRVERIAERSEDLAYGGRTFPGGRVLEEGDAVRAGDPLIHLNRDLLEARYNRVLAQYEYDQREYRRLLDLFESGSTSQTELDDARTSRDIAKAQLEEAKRELERTTIAAPETGILNDLPMEVGEYAQPGMVVAQIVNLEQVKVVVDVPEQDVHCVHVGDEVRIFTDVPAELELVGKITYMSALADASTRTTRVEVTIENHEQLLRSGQIVRARLLRRVVSDAIMIPLDSVIPLEHGRVVYVVDDRGQAVRREVELGLIQGRQVRVVGGLEVGDRLIVAGHRYVGPGQLVKEVAQIER